mmetsp:Transcript_96995/g.278725  ORF Transcript_96995/g.278725 Transcript_96995/m.278725 type:complete len:459 (-) Transcript_96995:81-1457(-)
MAWNLDTVLSPTFATKRRERRAATQPGLAKLLARAVSVEVDFARLGLSQDEVDEACCLFKERLKEYWQHVSTGFSSPKARRQTLSIEDVDMVLRQLKVFVSQRYISALFQEVDENDDGWVDQEEFLMMVAKLRGRRQLSSKFYVRSIDRSTRERHSKVFSVLDSDQDGLLTEDDVLTGLRQLSHQVNADSEEFREIIAQVSGENAAEEHQFTLDDFLAVQAQVRRAPPSCEAAAYSLSEAEIEKYEESFQKWRATRQHPDFVSPQELKAFLGTLGLQTAWSQTKDILEELELESIARLESKHFLYLLVRLGASSCTRPRSVLRPGSSYEDAFKLGFKLEDLWELGYDDLVLIRKAGWTAQHVLSAGLAEPCELRKVGYGARDLRHVGLESMVLRLAGFTLDDLRNAGFSSAVLRECARFTGSASRPTTADSEFGARGTSRGGPVGSPAKPGTPAKLTR